MNIKIDVDIVGVALLVSNDYKTLGKGTEMPFTHADASDLEKTLGKCSYAVYKKENVSAKEFVSYCESMAEFEYPPTCNRILVYYSGIGSNGTLLMQHGGTVNTEDLMSTFKVSTANNVTLANIAKMFFFDTFCGSREVKLYYDSLGGKEADGEITSLKKFPRESSVLVAYCSTQDSSYVTSTGSRWTNCLVTALRQSKERDDVSHILTCANVMMREQGSHCFQSEFTSSLVDLVCFKQKGRKV